MGSTRDGRPHVYYLLRPGFQYHHKSMAIDPSQPITADTIKTPNASNPLIKIDTILSQTIHALCLPIPRFFLTLLEFSGDGRLFFPFILSLIPFLFPKHPFLLSLLIGGLLDLIVVGLIKFIVRRPRPVYNRNMSLVVAVDHWSFPSGHSSRVFFIAFFIYLLELGSDFDFLVKWVLIWAGITSASRVMLGRHFVGDVFAGALLGVAEAVFVHSYLKF